MTSPEFVTWLRGFVAGSNNYNLTPQGWDTVKENLAKVNDAGKVSISFGPTSTSTTTTLPSEASVSYTTNDKIFLHD